MRDTLLMVMNIVIIIWNLLTNINDFAARFFVLLYRLIGKESFKAMTQGMSWSFVMTGGQLNLTLCFCFLNLGEI